MAELFGIPKFQTPTQRRMRRWVVSRKPWSPMEVTRVGSVADVLRMPGGGKLSAVGGDPGDPRKPKGQG